MSGNWDDLITEAEAERFVGREQEMDFRRERQVPRNAATEQDCRRRDRGSDAAGTGVITS